MIGKTISRYHIRDKLGEGGMGVVYRAYDERLRRQVAIKALPAVVSEDPVRRRRLLEEARAASALAHPGLMTVHDILTFEGRDVLVLELVPGEPLSRRITRDGMSWEEVVHLALPLAEAVAAAHAAGIVHRDLKPANVMVLPTSGDDGREPRVKVLDFGLAVPARRASGAEGPAAVETSPGAGAPAAGTPAFMSPEQVLGEPLDGRSDVFSCGVMLYWMLTGRRPFRGAHVDQIFRETIYAVPPDVRSLRPEVPAGLGLLVGRMLEKNPSTRPLMAAVAEELRRLQGGEEPDGRTESGLRAILVSETWESLVAELAPPDEDSSAGAGPGVTEPLGFPDGPTMPSAATTDFRWNGPAAGSQPSGAPLPLPRPGRSKLPHSVLRRSVEEHGGTLVLLRTVASAPCPEGTEDPSPIRTAPIVAALFQRPLDAVRFGLRHTLDTEGSAVVHVAEVLPHEDPAPWPTVSIEPLHEAVLHGLRALASARQVLLGAAAFDLARGESRRLPDEVEWLAHGDYLLQGVGGAVEVYEVGILGRSYLTAPEGIPEARRASTDAVVLGPRPAPGLAIPRRPDWRIERRLGQGSFGEVWLARHAATGEPRVFKFCWEAELLRTLRQEILVFRLLKEELGERDDIARILDWSFDQEPYFIESTYTAGGDLVQWVEARGGWPNVPLEDRLELVAQAATALGAAHSVGVLHKDVKPSNLLVAEGTDGQPRAVLADFGIGLITDEERLRARGLSLPMTRGTSATATQTATGTYLYMAPELFGGQRPTVQSDLYALGILLFQVVIGDTELPPAAGWERQIEDDLLRDDIARAIDGNPDRRPRSAVELAQDLRALPRRREARAEEARLQALAERTARRRRMAKITSLVGSVFLVVVSVLAMQAIRARSEAEAGRARAEQLIDVMLGDLHDGLERVGRLDLLETAARGSQQYFDTLAADPLAAAPANRVAETAERGQSLLNVGDVLLDGGDLPGARHAYRRAYELFAEGARLSPDAPELQDGLRRSLLARGQTEMLAGIPEAGLEFLEPALALVSSTPKALDPDTARLNEARVRLAMCNALDRIGDSAAALQRCREVRELLEAVTGSLETSQEHDEIEVESSVLFGGFLRDEGRGREALMEYRRAEEICRRRAAADPQNALWPRHLAWIRFQIGFVLLVHEDDLDGAGVALGHARDDYERLVLVDARRARWRDNLARTLNYLGRIELMQSRPESAIDPLLRASRLLDDLIAEDPERTIRFGLASRVHQTLGSVYLALGDSTLALASFRQALSLDTRRAEASGEDPGPWNAVSWSLLEIGRVHASRGEHEAARQAWFRSLELIEPITRRSGSLNYLDTHTQVLLELGQTEPARPLATRLLENGWNDPGFLSLLHRAGLGDLL